MRGEIVAGDLYRFLPEKLIEHVFELVPINSAWMVEVKASPACGRELRAIAIEVIQREPGGFASKRDLKLAGQPGFAGSAATDNCDEDWRAGIGHSGFSRR